ncbi:MAG TPA: sensor histidine kinase, partial [Peptostreptococcaceae bacterium]|nr:sensor histidine kinase [Peptostreptococcaceae bacterium]
MVYTKDIDNKKDVIKNSITFKLLNPVRESYLIRSIGQKWAIIFCIFTLIQLGIVALLTIVGGFGLEGIVVIFGFSFVLNLLFYLYTTRKLSYLNKIIIGTEQIAKGDTNYKIEVNNKSSLGELAENINNIKQGLNEALENEMKSERMKAELITNVSHDLKTPLTSIINYVNILKSEDLKPDHVKDYVNVLDKKSQRLKILIEDLFEASKATSGSMELQISKVEVTQLLRQSLAEMEEKIMDSTLDFKVNMPNDKIYTMADGRKIWRVFENLISNILKYSLKNTRVYIDVTQRNDNIYISMKNISTYELNFDPSEITERFKRGDESRNTEGSGLGLAIAKSLVELQGGKFDIEIDGDLFKVTLIFKSI